MASRTSVSRRNVLKKAAAAVGGGAAAGLLGGGVAAAQAPAILTGTQAGRRFRAFMAFENAPNTSIQAAKSSIETVTMKALDPDRVVVRTEAAQVCYTIVGQVVGKYKPPAILGHSAVGIVEAIGTRVKRVQVGDRVLLANTPQCGQCYNCLRGRADRCMNTRIVPDVIGTLSDGTEVIQQHDRGGFAELVIPPESYCIPIFHSVSPLELSMLGCSGACGLGTTVGVAPVEVGSDVVVLGCGPLGLSAVQGARIKGASQIIAVEPIASRRAVAQQLGATTVIDPNVDTNNVVARIRDLCRGPSDRLWAGGRPAAQPGPDFVIEAVGGDIFPPKAEVGPDPDRHSLPAVGVDPVLLGWSCEHRLCRTERELHRPRRTVVERIEESPSRQLQRREHPARHAALRAPHREGSVQRQGPGARHLPARSRQGRPSGRGGPHHGRRGDCVQLSLGAAAKDEEPQVSAPVDRDSVSHVQSCRVLRRSRAARTGGGPVAPDRALAAPDHQSGSCGLADDAQLARTSACVARPSSARPERSYACRFSSS